MAKEYTYCNKCASAGLRVLATQMLYANNSIGETQYKRAYCNIHLSSMMAYYRDAGYNNVLRPIIQPVQLIWR